MRNPATIKQINARAKNPTRPIGTAHCRASGERANRSKRSVHLPTGDCEPTYCKCNANRRDEPSTERLRQQSSSPVAGRLIPALTVVAKQSAAGREGKANIDGGASAVSRPAIRALR